MYYCLGFFPDFSVELSGAIDTIRGAYDPTSPYYLPHATLIFPTHERIGEAALINHIQSVLAEWSPFDVRFGGFHRTPNHWLMLGVQEGEAEVKKLYRALHAGVLDDGRDFSRFRPQLGLGLFVKEGVVQDWHNPHESDFDKQRYDKALRLAQALPLAETVPFEKLLLTTIHDSVIDWTRGRRADLPEDAAEIPVREFRFGERGA
jgi:2'-5' RNA ligase